jgi:hypothetical protein
MSCGQRLRTQSDVLQISSGIDSLLQQAIEAATMVVLPNMQSG